MTSYPDNRRVFTLPRSFDADELLPRGLHRYADDARYLASTIIRKTARGQAVVYIGPDVERFAEAFSVFGFIDVRATAEDA